MKIINHSKFIIELENFLDDGLCDEIVHGVETNEVYKNNLCEKTRVRHNKSINLTIDHRFKKVDELVHDVITAAHYHYFERCIFSHYLQEYYCNLTCDYIYRYYDSGDYYEWHVDKDVDSEYIFSYLVYLNDDFEGGDTLFLADKLKVKPKKGSVLCFPCDFTYIHKSSKIKSGTKKVIWTCMGRAR